MKPISTMMANDRLPAICGRTTESRVSQMLPNELLYKAKRQGFSDFQIVENTGNIMLAMIMECRKPRSRKLYRTIA